MRVARLTLAVLVAVALWPSAAHGLFSSSANPAQSVSTATLQPPSAPAVSAGNCAAGVGDQAIVSWTASPSGWGDGYEVHRSTSSGGPYSVVATVSGVSTVSYTDSDLAFSTTYYYVVRSVYALWTSTTTTEVTITTRPSTC